MTKSDSTISAEYIRKAYAALGVDVERFLDGLERFELHDGPHGLKVWSPVVAGDGKFYEQLSAHSWYYSKNKDEFEVARKFIGKSNVLEVGCGSGYFADGSLFDSYIGLELNHAAAREARGKGHRVEECLLSEYADQNPGTVDVVCSFQVLEHMTDPADYFSSARKLLRPGGKLVTSVPAEDSFVGACISNVLNAPPHHLTRWTDHALKTFPIELGFRCSDIVHLPVERQHYKWFWSELLWRGFVPCDGLVLKKNSSIMPRIRRKVAMAVLSALGFNFCVPEDFFIPGHTVVVIHEVHSD